MLECESLSLVVAQEGRFQRCCHQFINKACGLVRHPLRISAFETGPGGCCLPMSQDRSSGAKAFGGCSNGPRPGLADSVHRPVEP